MIGKLLDRHPEVAARKRSPRRATAGPFHPSRLVSLAPQDDGSTEEARCPLRRSTVISANIDIAISSGVIAPRSSPAGALTRSSASGDTPPATSFSRSAAILRWLPT